MSWLSSWLNKQGAIGKGINKIGGPVVKAVGKVAHEIPGVGSVMDLAETAGNYIPDPFNHGSVGGSGSGIKLPGVSGVDNLLGDAGKFLTGNNGLNALGIVQGINAAQLGQKSSDYADKAQQAIQGAWDAKSALRGPDIINRIANPRTPNLLGVDAMRIGANPFAKPLPGVMPAPGGR